MDKVETHFMKCLNIDCFEFYTATQNHVTCPYCGSLRTRSRVVSEVTAEELRIILREELANIK